VPNDHEVRGHPVGQPDPCPYRFHVHKAVPAWRLVLLAGAKAPPGLREVDWRFTRARTAGDTNPDIRRHCDDQGFSLFKLGGTFADVAADVAAASQTGRSS